MAGGTLQIPPPAFEDPFVEEDGELSSDAFNWFVITVLPRISRTPSIFGTAPPISLPGQNAAILPTDIPLGSLTSGLYRVTVYTRITSPDGAASSVQPFLDFTDGGVSCTMTGAAMTSDAIDAPLSQSFLLNVLAPGPIRYGVNYSSTTPNAAVYTIIITVERVQ